MDDRKPRPHRPVLRTPPQAAVRIVASLRRFVSTRTSVIALGFVLAGFLGASVDALASGAPLHIPTQAVWLYLPLVVFVTIRWGLLRGLAVGLASIFFVLWFVVAPLGTPFASDPMAVALLTAAGGGMLATALTVAKLNHRRLLAERRGRAEAESLADIGHRISASLDLQEVLRATAESAHRLVRADVTYIALIRGSRSLEVAAAVGNRTALLHGHLVPALEGLSGAVLENGRPVRVHWDDPAAAPQSRPAIPEGMAAEGIVSTLGVPILRASEVVGVFWVHSRTHREFADAEVSLLGRLATQAGVAIANAKAHAAEREARAEVEALLAATASLGIQAEPEAVLRTLVEQATAMTDAERAVYLVRRDGTYVAPTHRVDDAWLEDGLEWDLREVSRQAWETGIPYRSNRVEQDPNPNPASTGRYELRSQLSAPLLGPEKERLGVITLGNSRRPEGFSERDERLLTAICETGAAVLLRAQEVAHRLLAEQSAERRRQEIEGLLAAADRLNSAVDPGEVLRQVLEITADLLAVERAGLAINEGDQALRQYTLIDGVWCADNPSLQLDESLAGWVMRHGRPYRTSDLTDNSPAFPPASSRSTPTRALCVPIASATGHVLGCLQLFNRRDGEDFSDDDQHLAEGIAHHAAVALERVRLEDQLRRQAFSDALTGLANRARFLDRLGDALDALPGRETGVAVLFVDLDGFKVINDSLGHPTGDALLKAVGERLAGHQRATNSVARFGGDEFAVLLEDIGEPEEALVIAGRILTDISRPFSLARHRGVFLTASVGIAVRDSAGPPASAEELLREADIALYEAKEAGKARAMVFADAMGRRVSERLELQTDLQHAVERGGLRLVYQPVVELATGQIVGAEALVRWEHPRRGRLDPHAFIPIAEETGLILPIGLWTLEAACRQAAKWRLSGSEASPFRISVNLSPLQLEPADLVEEVSRILRETGLEPNLLQLEITETAVMRQTESTLAKLTALKELGVHLALDDFGTGYSSLSYLQRLPVDTVKIDQSFMQGLSSGSSTAAIVRAVISLAHALGVAVTAEGIETADQAAFLSVLGCDQAQGFYFSKPGPAEAVTSLLRNRAQVFSVPRIGGYHVAPNEPGVAR